MQTRTLTVNSKWGASPKLTFIWQTQHLNKVHKFNKLKICMSLYLGCSFFVVCSSQLAITAPSYYKSFPCNNLLTPDQTRKEQRYKRTKGQKDKGTKFQKDKGIKGHKNHPTSRDKKKSRNLSG